MTKIKQDKKGTLDNSGWIPVGLYSLLIAIYASFYIKAVIDGANQKHKLIVIEVKDGEVVLSEDEYKGVKRIDYAVVNKTDDSMTINVYTTDPGKRCIYAEYLIDNIDIIENTDGSYSIEFDEDYISEKGYTKFAEKYISNQTNEGIQRKRG